LSVDRDCATARRKPAPVGGLFSLAIIDPGGAQPDMDQCRYGEDRSMALDVLGKIHIIQIIRNLIEAAMTQTTAVEFQRKFGEFQHQAQREPVEITRHGRRELVLMSADHYDWLVAAARRTHRTADAASVVAEAVRRAEMDPEHSGLDDLLK
jgi:prevent-host-death family protein